jgi:ElaB/YqjD/DUF883 family membrane-anchored ribosome-binding protein
MAQPLETDQRQPEAPRGPKQVISETVERTQEKLEGAGRTVQERMDRTRAAAADKLEGVATSLHDRGDKAGDLAHRAADKMEATARYMRDHDMRTMVGDAENIVKRRPGPSLFIAAVIGFLIGRAFRTSD